VKIIDIILEQETERSRMEKMAYKAGATDEYDVEAFTKFFNIRGKPLTPPKHFNNFKTLGMAARSHSEYGKNSGSPSTDQAVDAVIAQSKTDAEKSKSKEPKPRPVATPANIDKKPSGKEKAIKKTEPKSVELPTKVKDIQKRIDKKLEPIIEPWKSGSSFADKFLKFK